MELLNRCVSENTLKCSTEEAFPTLVGSEFQLRGPAMENAQSPNFLEDRGTTNNYKGH